MGEFNLIERAFRRHFDFQHPLTRIPNGDDASVHCVPEGHELVLSTDMSVAGVHWPLDFPLADAACRAVNAALSDLAAMGAEPCWVWCCAVIEHEAEAAQMGKGIAGALLARGIELAGGDTVRSTTPALAVTVAGVLPSGTAMRRDAAKPGDDLCLCGQAGLAALGLELWQQGIHRGSEIDAFRDISPRLTEGIALRKAGVRCCIDVSDGLLADVSHLALQSSLAMDIELSDVPGFDTLKGQTDRESAIRLVLGGGEDYALAFCAPQSLRETLAPLAKRIGICRQGAGVRALLDGVELQIEKGGFDHFE